MAQLSFEFFPPKTAEGDQALLKTATTLSEFNPEYFSVTFGAGGSTRVKTFETVQAVKNHTNISVAPHISCIGASVEDIHSLLEQYQKSGISRLVALRGDIPSGMGGTGAFRYAADLVQFIREQTGNHFSIEVGAYPEYHPEAKTPGDDFTHFVEKIKAGANSAITQYFYNADSYFAFVEACQKEGLDIPITPGIMPIMGYTQLARFSDNCGAEIPRWIRQKLAAFEAKDDKASLKAFGIEVVTQLCERLLAANVPGLHFYTLNKYTTTQTILKNLGLS